MGTLSRDNSMDLFKGILTIGMIAAHIFIFFPLNGITHQIILLVSLTAFSGFMFSFGYTSYIAYYSKDLSNKEFFKKISNGFIKTIAAYYILGIIYIFFEEKKLTLNLLSDVLLFNKISGGSEFLLSFAFMYIVIYIFRDVFKNIKYKLLIVLIMLSLLMTNFPHDYIKSPIVGVFVGTSSFSCFPLVQYISYFLIGVYMSKNNIVYKKSIYLVSIFCFLIFIYGIATSHFTLKRFSPSFIWIIGGYYLVYSIYLICKKRQNSNTLLIFVQKIGQKTLNYLVVSNILIFSSAELVALTGISLNIWWHFLLLYGFLFSTCIGAPYMYNKFTEKQGVLKQL